MAGKPRININYNKVYYSNSSGPFKIIENLGRDERSKLFVKIQFLETGTIKNIRYDLTMAGKVVDDLYNINFNKIYNSIYYGTFKIIKYIGRNNESKRMVRIKFTNTGYENNVLLNFALSGRVKDYSLNFKNISKSISTIEYDEYILNILKNRWNSMMQRCYNSNDSKFSEYGALGITESERWKTFDNYISDIYLVKNFNKFYNYPNIYQLDKDYLQLNIPKSNRIYSTSTCIFLSIYDNANLAIKESHINGELYGIRKLNNGNYKVEFSIDGAKVNFGIYTNIIAAANAYNYYYVKYSKAEYIQLINENIEYIPIETCKKYLISNGQV